MRKLLMIEIYSKGWEAQPWREPDANLDPWTIVEYSGADCLFGYATYHNLLGGLAWSRSTAIMHLDSVRGRAITESRRQYALGCRVNPSELGDLEPRLALLLLTGQSHMSASEEKHAMLWLSCRKWSRWLRISAPAYESNAAALIAWLSEYGPAYRTARKAKAQLSRDHM